MTSDEDRIEFGAWAGESVEYRLVRAEAGDVRGPDDAGSELPSDQQPCVSLPAATFDCVRLDALREHPAIDPVVRSELAAGVPFRLLRFPFSLRPPVTGRVTEARFTVELLPGDGAAARVHSIYPERVQVEGDEQTREAAIEPTLSIGSAVEIGAGRVGRKIVTRLARSTTVGFWSETGAEWVVRPPSERDDGLEGTWEFLVIVRWPGEVLPLRVALAVSAEVASRQPLLVWRTRRARREYEPLELAGCAPIA